MRKVTVSMGKILVQEYDHETLLSMSGAIMSLPFCLHFLLLLCCTFLAVHFLRLVWVYAFDCQLNNQQPDSEHRIQLIIAYIAVNQAMLNCEANYIKIFSAISHMCLCCLCTVSRQKNGATSNPEILQHCSNSI